MAAVVSLVLTPSFYSLINLGTQPWISLEGTVRCDLDNRPCLYYHRMKKKWTDARGSYNTDNPVWKRETNNEESLEW